VNKVDETVMFNRVIDEILASEDAKEYEDEKVGKNEYYFSEYSKNMDIIEQFTFNEDFLKKDSEFYGYLKELFKEYIEEEITNNEDFFRSWLNGERLSISFEGYIGETLIEDLMVEYRKRIKSNYNCESCRKIISERFPFGHRNHLYRIGIKKTNGEEYEETLYCKACYEGRLK